MTVEFLAALVVGTCLFGVVYLFLYATAEKIERIIWPEDDG